MSLRSSIGGRHAYLRIFLRRLPKAIRIILTLAEYEEDKIKCPKCGGKHVHQEAAAFFAVTSKKS
jgi:hypothetical protein